METFFKTENYLCFMVWFKRWKIKYIVNKIPHLETHFLLRIFNNLLIFYYYDNMVCLFVSTHLETSFPFAKKCPKIQKMKKGGKKIRFLLHKLSHNICVIYSYLFHSHCIPIKFQNIFSHKNSLYLKSFQKFSKMDIFKNVQKWKPEQLFEKIK